MTVWHSFDGWISSSQQCSGKFIFCGTSTSGLLIKINLFEWGESREARNFILGNERLIYERPRIEQVFAIEELYGYSEVELEKLETEQEMWLRCYKNI